MPRLPDIAPFKLRRDELDARMASPEFYANPKVAAEVTREHQKLCALLDDYAALEKVDREIADAEGIACEGSGTDAEMRELAAAELPGLRERREALGRAVMGAMLPPEPSDSRDTILEIRAGTGGEEAALFAAELARAYQRYAEGRGWTFEALGTSLSERGGFREASFAIKGRDVYRQMKFESGVHRVQRVPETEAAGRVHTSTVTVAVLPEAGEVDVKIDPQELEITVQRASGPGGQGVNTTDSAVRIVHKPTGLTVYCADGRSQQKNKASALAVLRARLLQRKEEEERAHYAAERRGQIGTGDRSERVRTYNFPQNRLTDHRIGLTLHNLPRVMEGGFDEVMEALQRDAMEKRLGQLTIGN
ncbi:MAG: peptide chain release factor 1 [Opitutaceae bacterium]|jgi:peptide chain release factor 1|nr:peptide chain release factor 1 [Opitutaceae bacterium]